MKNLICNQKTTLLDAWKVINNNGKNIVFIVDKDNYLKGVLTDGDIRAYLIDKQDFNIQVSVIMNKKYVSANVNISTKELLPLFNDRVRIIPLVTENNILVDYVEYNNSLHIPVAIPDLKGTEFQNLTDAFLSTWISSSGKYIDRFESEFSSYCGTKYGVAVSNGTVALHLALESLGVGKGDEVIVPDLTFAATINSVIHSNATPVVVDVEEKSWCISPVEIRKAITPKTKAIIPVHLYGQVCDMSEIMKIADEFGLYVIEDCAEAHGAEYNGKKVGSFGDIGCFSFFGNKIITTGEGGMCITNKTDLNDRMRVLRDHGMSKTKRYWHDFIGFNYRMTNLQASIGVAQLQRIDEIIANRHDIDKQYRNGLKYNANIEFQNCTLPNRKKITWFVCILVNDNRNEILEALKSEGIDARPFFYTLSEMPIYKDYIFSSSISSNISKKGINLPTNSFVNKEIINKIDTVIRKVILIHKNI
jgi:perosamine synthetase